MSDEGNPLIKKCKLFLESRENSNCMVEILSEFEDVANVSESRILALQFLFVELLKRNELRLDNLNDSETEYKYRKWLLKSYYDAFIKLLKVVSKSKTKSVQTQALTTVFSLLELDKKHLSKKSYKGFMMAVETIIESGTDNSTDFIQILIEHINIAYEGSTNQLWIALASIVNKKSHQNVKKKVNNIIAIVNSLPKEKSSTKTETNKKPGLVNYSATTVWEWCLKHHERSSLKNLLIALLEHFMVLHKKPIFLTDFLIGSLNKDGSTSILALQGIFNLIIKHNIDYPDIYGKLYSMLQIEIFTMKYKQRFMYLLDLFLVSTHIPEIMVASFIKRLSRLALRCAPQDILIILPFIGNLFIRHPGLKTLLNHPTEENVNDDPFLVDENDPLKTNAQKSSLWEIKSLQEHVLPSVSRAAMFINEPLPSVEWDLADKLETTCDQIFYKERNNKKVKTISTTFERPVSLSVPRGLAFENIWSL